MLSQLETYSVSCTKSMLTVSTISFNSWFFLLPLLVEDCMIEHKLWIRYQHGEGVCKHSGRVLQKNCIPPNSKFQRKTKIRKNCEIILFHTFKKCFLEYRPPGLVVSNNEICSIFKTIYLVFKGCLNRMTLTAPWTRLWMHCDGQFSHLLVCVAL